MFASLTESIKSLARGPRAMLAAHIARALSEHFVLDPEDVAASLLRDARIVLADVRLRERQYRSAAAPQAVISSRGRVQEVEFSWRWSFGAGGGAAAADGAQGEYASGSGMIQDVVVKIKGLRVCVDLRAWSHLDPAEQRVVEGLTSTSSACGEDNEEEDDSKMSKTEKESFMEKYIQQVVDHLTLKVEDFQVVVGTTGDTSLVIAGDDVELGTLSSSRVADGQSAEATKTVLSQKLSLRNLSMHLDEGAGPPRRSQRSRAAEQKRPLLEPCGYTASVTRVAGERFRGGILSGLDIVGLPLDHLGAVAVGEEGNCAPGVVLHLGHRQVSFLSTVGLLLAPAPSRENTPSLDNDTGTEGRSVPSANEPTVFNLPFPSLNLVLPEPALGQGPTVITLPGCEMMYRTDGEAFVVKGQEGIMCDGHPLVDLGNEGEWSLDVANQQFALRSTNGPGDKTCCSTVTLDNDGLRRIFSSVDQVLTSANMSQLQSAWELNKDITPLPSERDQPLSSWTAVMDSTVLRLANSDSEWVEVRVQGFLVHVSQGGDDYSLSRLEVGETTVRSGFATEAHATVSPFELSAGTLRIARVDAMFASHGEMQALARLFLSFGDTVKSCLSKEPAAVHHGVVALSIPVILDHAGITVNKADSSIHLSNVRCNETSFGCNEIVYKKGKWEVKVLQSKIDIAYSRNKTISADIKFDQAAMSVYEGPDCRRLRGVASIAMMSANMSIKRDQPLALWSGSMDPTALRLTNSDSEWIEARVDGFQLQALQGEDAYSRRTVEVGAIELRSGFVKEAHVTVSPVKISAGTLHIPSVNARFSSHGEMQALKRLLLSFEAIARSSHQTNTSASMHRQALTLPLLVILDRVDITVKDSDSAIHLSNIRGNETVFLCDKVTCVQGKLEVNVQQSKIYDVCKQDNPTGVSAGITFDRATVSIYKEPTRKQLHTGASVTSMVANLSILECLLTFKMLRKIEFRLEDHMGDWLEGFIDTSKFKIDIKNTFDPVSFDSLGAGIASSSFGTMQVYIPSLQLIQEDNLPVIKVGTLTEDIIYVQAGSMDVIQQMQAFLSAVLVIYSSLRPPQSNNSPLGHEDVVAEKNQHFPYSINIYAVCVSFGATRDQCCLGSIAVPGDAKCSLKGITVSVPSVGPRQTGSAIKIAIEKIEEVRAPQMFHLAESIQNTTVLYSSGSLYIQTTSVKVQMLKSTKGREVSTLGSDLHIPFTIHIDVARFYLYLLLEEDVKAQVVGAKIRLSPKNGILNIDLENQIRLRIVHANQNIDLQFQPSSVAVSKSLTEIRTLHFGGGCIESCSLGFFSATLPPCTMLPETNTIIIDDSSALVNVGSVNLARKIQSWAMHALQCEPSESTSPLLIGVRITNLNFFVKDPSIRFTFTGISANQFVISCNQLNIQGVNGMCMSAFGLNMNFEDGYHVQVKAFNSLVLPGIMMLSAPVKNSSFMHKDTLKVALECVEGIVQLQKQSSVSKSSTFNLPAPADIKIRSIIIRDESRICMVSISDVGILANQSKSTVWLRTREGMKLKFQTSPDE